MNSGQEEFRDKYSLEATNKCYDGIDEDFYSLVDHPQFDRTSSIEVAFDANSDKSIMVYAKEPMFYLLLLGRMCKEFLQSKIEPGNIIDPLLHYIISWVDIQVEKLKNENEETECSQLSEFTLLSQSSNQNKLSYIRAGLSILSSLLTGTAMLYDNYELNHALAVSVSKLEKALSSTKSGQVLHNIVNSYYIKNTLAVLRYESTLSILCAYLFGEQYVLAEAFVNKTLRLGKKLHSTQQEDFSFLARVARARIAYKTNNIDMLLQSINDLVSFKLNKNFMMSGLSLKFGIVDACVYAGEYFEKNKDYEKSIKYYLEALRYSRLVGDEKNQTQKLSSLTGNLISQLADFIKVEFSDILKNVKPYPSHKRIDLYFDSEDITNKVVSLLKKSKITCSKIPGVDFAVAITGMSYEFDSDSFKWVLRKIKLSAKKERKPSIESNPEEKVLAQTAPKYIGGASGRHPQSKAKPKKVKKAILSETEVPNREGIRWQFLADRPKERLTRFEFPSAKKAFDPDSPTGVVTLCVSGMSGRWFACMNPKIVEVLNQHYKGEGTQLMKKFEQSIELANDLAVPCFKEMKLKSNDRYVFKIRLKGMQGKGDIRIYATVIDEIDNKKLVAFTAINFTAHDKHTGPTCYPMPSTDCKASKDSDDKDREGISLSSRFKGL